MAPNCGEHVLLDQAVVHAGGLPFTVYATSSPEQVAWLAQHSDTDIALLHGQDQLTRWAGARPRRTVVVDPVTAGGHPTYDELRAMGRELLASDPGVVDRRRNALAAEDPVALVYTSGTTGRPKGVVLSHRNVLYKAEAWRRSTGVGPNPVSISYLPYAHVSERVNGLYVPFLLGGHVHFCGSLEEFPELLARVRPHSLTAVPRIWEKVIARAECIGAASPERMLAVTGLDRAVCIASTAAPASPAVGEFFERLGLPVASVYGMTETTGGITANRPAAHRPGTVGRLVAGCEARIAGDGELLVRGPLVTSGYLGDPDATAEFLDSDGWAHTGDLAAVEDGYLRIVGRKKDLLVTAGGENVAPLLVENLLQQHPAVAQAMACGDGRRYVTALIVPSAGASEEDLAAAVAAANERLARVQQIKTWRTVDRPWTVESGELTPTLKLRRQVVAARCAHLVEDMYATESMAVTQ
ncbi:AMP-dependent synthetase/ligase [Sporichthya brevicatena]|uniref:Acyl-CoA synthetase n=2 Tax=Sporichthya brevicatena TaxID=171442 RepID=A0ABN1G411_9ACTN